MTTQTLIGWARACRKQGFHSNLGEIADVLEAQAREIERLEALHVTTMMDELQPALEERDTLRAELAAIAAAEPSMIYHGRCVIDCGDSGHHDVTMLKMIARETKLFTHPMPAQDVTGLVDALEDLHRQYAEHPDAFWDWSKARTALSKYKGAK